MKTCKKATIFFLAMLCLMISAFPIGIYIDVTLGFGVISIATMGSVFASIWLDD